MTMEPNVFVTKDKDGNTHIDDQSIWRARKTKTVTLLHWNIVDLHTEGDGDTQHFVGSDSWDNTGRISTDIQELDIRKQSYKDEQGQEHEVDGIGYTKSGTEYLLVGNPGDLGMNASYLFNRVFIGSIEAGEAKLRYGET